MKKIKWKRIASALLALVLVVSNVTPGIALQASAAEYKKTVGEIMAENYGLSEAEKNLLASGYLTGSYTVEYDGVQDSWVAVDPDSKKITADEKNGWIAKTAEIVVNSETVETVTMTNGQGYYKYAGNTFDVKVNYEQYISVENQQNLLDSVRSLQNAIANANVVSEQAGNMYILEQAMPALVNLAKNGISASMGTVELSDECKVAVNALNGQMTANGGQLNLSVMAAAYDADSKTHYVSTKGDEMAAEVQTLLSNVSAINVLTGTMDNLVDWGFFDPETAQQIRLLANVCASLEKGLASVPAEWNAEGHVKDGANYAELDTLLANADLFADIVLTPLKVAEASVQYNVRNCNITVLIYLNKTEDKADSAEIVKVADKETSITLEAGATAAEIEAAIAATGFEAAALKEWGAEEIAQHFNREESALPGTLTEDITYEIVYAPKEYTVSGVINDTVPYGYQLTLPKHEDETKSYDYKVTKNGVVQEKSQGTVYFVDADILVERASGKAYTTNTLMNIIGENFGNEKVQKILGSGALYNNPAVNVRYPDAGKLTLAGGNITASDYPSDYKGLMWVPYSYGAEGTENLFSGNTGAWAADQAKVIYRLNVGYSAEDAAQILAMVETLESEANAQKNTLDRLAAYQGQMGQLNGTLLSVLISTVESSGGISDTFINNLKEIRKNHTEDMNLRIYNMITAYKDEYNGGLTYYYLNSEAVRNEIKAMSELMAGLVENPDDIGVLKDLVIDMGFADYADKLDNLTELESALANAQASLTAPNAVINLNSESVPVLTAALEMSEKVSYSTPAAPYLESVAMSVVSSDKPDDYLLGDANRDGKVTATDYSRILAHVKKVNLITDEETLKIADVTGDGNVSATDYSRLLAHVKKVSPLW